MPENIPLESAAQRCRTTVDALRKFASFGWIEIVEQDGGCFLTEQALCKARFIAELLRTRKINASQIIRLLATQSPDYRAEDIRWTAAGA